MTRCPYNDCGWCYAPDDVEKNDKSGECHDPMECPVIIKSEREGVDDDEAMG